MKQFPIKSELIEEAVDCLKNGGVVAHPADTCYGLACNLFDEKALQKIKEIKGRDGKKPMSIMLPPMLKLQLEDYARLDEFSRFVCDALLPGPVTIVLPKGPKIPDYFFPEIDTVGIRIPYDLATDELLLKLQEPLVTTSANLSGEPCCSNSGEVEKAFTNNAIQPDLILTGAVSGSPMPSTVIRLEKNKVYILREGPVKKKQLEALLGMEVEG